jgi:hypothetical protein
MGIDGWEDTGRGGIRRKPHTQVPQLVEDHADYVGADSAVVPVQSPDLSFVAKSSSWVRTRLSSVTSKVRESGSSPSLRAIQIKFNEPLGIPECPYAIRWRIETPWGSARVHHWLAPDDDRAFHDHPWDFVTFVFKGGYTDKSPDGEHHLRAPYIQHRSATHQHTVYPDADGAWTFLVTGPKTRNWGFWLDGKFRKANKWFLTFGHHPCE